MLLTSPIETASVVYLTADEVVYSFVNNFPTRCNPNFDQNYKKLVASKGAAVWINCEEKPAKDEQMTPKTSTLIKNSLAKDSIK